MKTSELREKYPKAMTKFKQYISILLSEGEVEPPDDLVDVFLQNTPRMLYDFFDREKVFVIVYLTVVGAVVGDGVEEIYFASSVSTIDYSESFAHRGVKNNRPEAELDGFLKAFELLENK